MMFDMLFQLLTASKIFEWWHLDPNVQQAAAACNRVCLGNAQRNEAVSSAARLRLSVFT